MLHDAHTQSNPTANGTELQQREPFDCASTSPHADENLAAALELAAAGIPIFPARLVDTQQNGRWNKIPCIKNWQTKSTTDPNQIREWWGKFPDAVPGIELARANLIVVDADRHGGPDGVAALTHLAAERGGMPPGPVTLTPGNGEHYIFRQPDGEQLGNRSGILPEGIDVRGAGGWIVAPGAIRPDGRRWELAPGTPSLADAYRNRTIPPLPNWIDALIRSRPHANPSHFSDRSALGTDAHLSSSPDHRGTAYAAATLSACVDDLSRARAGTRNNSLNISAFRMGRMIARGWVEKSDVVDALWRACELNGLLRDDGTDNVQATLASGLTSGLEHPHPDLGERPRSQNGQHSDGPTTGQQISLSPITLSDLLDLDIKPREFVIEPLIHERGLVMVYAWRGVGKTWFAIGIGHAIAIGGTYLRWTAKRPRRVLHICGEMPAADLKQRFEKVVAATKDKPPEVGYFRIVSADLHERGIPDLATPQGQAQMDAVIGDAEVIIFDNVSTLFRTGQENESESWVPVQNWLLKLRREGRAVVIIHHSNKARAQRGTSKREDVLDVVLNLREPSDYEPSEGARFEVHFEKARGLSGTDAVSPFEAKLELRDDAALWSMRDIEDARLTEILDLREEGMTVRKIAVELGFSKSAVQRALNKGARGRS